MKRIRQSLYYIILMAICLVGVAVPAFGLELAEGEDSAKCDGCQMELSKTQEAAIVDYCASIKDILRATQKSDARARVYLGGRYETILNKYITPLNVRLVENNLSTANLIESQNTVADSKIKFSNDYIDYQQRLEELVALDCKDNPRVFYEKLGKVRQKRMKVEQDTQKIRNDLMKYMELVNAIKDKLNA